MVILVSFTSDIPGSVGTGGMIGQNFRMFFTALSSVQKLSFLPDKNSAGFGIMRCNKWR
jgi:hypothetical protein